MRYTLNSRVINGLRAVSRRLERQRILRGLWLATSPLLAGFCYMGILLSFPIIGLLPYNVLMWLKLSPPSPFYWIVAMTAIASMLGVTYLAVVALSHRLKMLYIDIEALVVILSSLLAAYLGVHFLPTGL